MIAIKCSLSSPESVESEAAADYLSRNPLQASKSESEALRLKQDGNDLFRKKSLLLAIRKYTMVDGSNTFLISYPNALIYFIKAIFHAPWSPDLLREVADECLEALLTDSPAKCAVAKRLHSTTEGRASQDVSMEKQSTPLLATCFGNRSAALFELGKTEVCCNRECEHARSIISVVRL